MNLLFFLSTFLVYPSFAFSAVLINEFVYDPAGADTGFEWIELYNTSNSTVTLEGWTIEVDDNRFPGTAKVSLCGSIAPFGFYLIKESTRASTASAVADLVSGTIGMGNANTKSDGIQLLDNDGNLQDRVVYGLKDTDGLCDGVCSTAPSASNGFGIGRSVPGSPVFLASSLSNLTPTSGFGHCAMDESNKTPIHFFLLEIAPSIPYGDFVEIFADETCNLKGAKLYEGEKLIKVFPSATVRSSPFGPLILFHASIALSENNRDETDLTGDINSNGVIDLYSQESSPGLSGSVGNNLTLKNPDGSIADFISWTVKGENEYHSFKQQQYDRAAAQGRWVPFCSQGMTECYLSGSVLWSNKSSESLNRNDQSIGPSNWSAGSPTPGTVALKDEAPRSSLLQILQSPFSPFGGGPYREAVIQFQNAEDCFVTIEIYNLNGVYVQTLVKDEFVLKSEPRRVTWDGKNWEGKTASVGVYLVHLRVRTEKEDQLKDTGVVVVAGNL